jgi:hypothetical protein
MGLILFACLLSGPKARWVKRFLPNTANRVVFVIIVGALILALGLQGYKTFTGGTLEGVTSRLWRRYYAQSRYIDSLSNGGCGLP